MAAAKAEADAAAEREKEQRNAAATRLQAQHRGLLARKEVEEMARRAEEEAAKGSDDSSDCMTDEEDDDQSHVKKWDAAEDWDGKDGQGIAVQFFELQRKKNTQEKQIVQGARPRPPRPRPRGKRSAAFSVCCGLVARRCCVWCFRHFILWWSGCIVLCLVVPPPFMHPDRCSPTSPHMFSRRGRHFIRPDRAPGVRVHGDVRSGVRHPGCAGCKRDAGAD